MKTHNEGCGVAKTARALGVSCGGYCAWQKRKPCKRSQEEQELSGMINQIYKKHCGRYGSPRVFEELRERGHRIGRKRAERLMRPQCFLYI